MPPDAPSENIKSASIETRLAVVEKDINSMSNLYDKLDASISKLAEVASAIKELIAVHENKFENQAVTLTYVFREIEEMKTDINEIRNNVTNIKEEVTSNINKIRSSLIKYDKLIWIASGVVLTISTIVGYVLSTLEYINPLKSLFK